MKLRPLRRQITAWSIAMLLLGCGSPVVDPGRSTTPLAPPVSPPVTPPVAIPQPSNSLERPTLDTSDIPQVPAESVINLPSESNTANYHSVQAGETLASIAKKYRLSVEQLRAANGLDASATLKSQQLLYIPQPR
ncbi:MAG: LysM peptidoglycan-binding domain-containing protein [Planctomycetaceae bacterium]